MENTTVIEQTTQAVEEAMQYKFAITPDNFISSLPIMAKGMAGILLVMAIIIACVALLNYVTSPDRKAKSEAKKKAKQASKNNQAQ